MPHYLILWNWTDQGIRNVKDAPTRIASARASAEELGGKLTVYYTIGAYDTVGIAEFPNDETLATFLLSLGKLGNVRSTALRAFSESEAASLIAKLA
ncbi:MAG: GYD domain-containing protein [Nitrososphaerota archaeon]|nr:GYD domain-containing protein [Nitrososphaerota archaeon]